MTEAGVHRHNLAVRTWLALMAPRRSIPILLITVPLVIAQVTLGYGGWIPGFVGAVMCATFVAVGPLCWRALFPVDRKVRWAPVRLILFGLVGAVCVGLTGILLPEAMKMTPSMMTAPTETHLVTTAMFWVGGWGLGRDIDLEESLVAEQERAEELAREAERAQLMALRSHLDPHFLFNTLNAIAEWCREDGEVAERAVLELSRVLRTVLLGVKTSAWTVHKEVELLRTLFDLHLLRDPELFELKVTVDQEAEAAEIPSMILLPLAENAMKHGPGAGHRGLVELRVAVCEDEGGRCLEATIENPGAYTGRREGGEGIQMVERRLALATDRRGELSIGPAENPERTRATVRWPLVPGSPQGRSDA